PKSRACFDKNKQPYFDRWLRKQFRYAASGKHRLSVLLMPGGLTDSKYASWPERPTHLLQIDYDTADGGRITLTRMIAQEDRKWYQVAPCPTDAGMERFREQQRREDAARERAKQAYGRVTELLASQVRELVARNDRALAWKLCARSLKVDILT